MQPFDRPFGPHSVQVFLLKGEQLATDRAVGATVGALDGAADRADLVQAQHCLPLLPVLLHDV